MASFGCGEFSILGNAVVFCIVLGRIWCFTQDDNFHMFWKKQLPFKGPNNFPSQAQGFLTWLKHKIENSSDTFHTWMSRFHKRLVTGEIGPSEKCCHFYTFKKECALFSNVMQTYFCIVISATKWLHDNIYADSIWMATINIIIKNIAS